jgi:hypothetical protein
VVGKVIIKKWSEWMHGLAIETKDKCYFVSAKDAKTTAIEINQIIRNSKSDETSNLTITNVICSVTKQAS